MRNRIAGEVERSNPRNAGINLNVFKTQQKKCWPEQVCELSRNEQRSERHAWFRGFGSKSDSKMTKEHKFWAPNVPNEPRTVTNQRAIPWSGPEPACVVIQREKEDQTIERRTRWIEISLPRVPQTVPLQHPLDRLAIDTGFTSRLRDMPAMAFQQFEEKTPFERFDDMLLCLLE